MIARDSESFEKGVRLVMPYLHLNGQNVRSTSEDQFKEGVRLLESCASQDFWQANWFLGKAYESNKEYNKSALRFSMAYAVMPTRTDVVHEYMVALLRIHQNGRANTIADIIRNSDDPVLGFDAALAKLFCDKPSEALQILNEFKSWPDEFRERVGSLRQRIVEKFGEKHSVRQK